MQVVEYDRHGEAGEVTRLRERPIPRPRAGELLVRVCAAALNPKDVLLRSGKLRLLGGLRFPKRLGYDFAGEVAAVGARVRAHREGDPVFGMLQRRAGTLAEYCLASEDELWRKPPSLSWEEAAALPLTALTALQALRDDARMVAGERVLIHGASGGVGVAAVQIASALGARVTGVTSARNRELVLSLGSEQWLDYGADDAFAGSTKYDVIFDVFGNQRLARVKTALAPRGRYVTTVPKPAIFVDALRTAFSYPRARLVIVRSRASDLAWVAELVEQGKLRAVVHGVYTLAQAAEAQRQVESKHTRGKVVLRIAQPRA